MVIEERPDAGLTIATSVEVRLRIGHLPTELLVLALEPSLLAGIGNHVLRMDDLRVVTGHDAYAALVGMTGDGIVRNAHRAPDHAALIARALHLHNPCLIGIADSEGLAFRAIAILLRKRRHHLDGLTCRPGTLQADVNQGTVVDQPLFVDHLLASSVGCLADSDLILIDIAYHIVCLRCLRYLAEIAVRVPVDDIPHRALRMLGRGIVGQSDEHAIIVRVVSTHHGPVG